MPIVNIKLIEGVYSREQKQEMIRRITDVMVDLGGEHMRPVTMVVIEEVKGGDWGIGGKASSIADVKALGLGVSRISQTLYILEA